MISAAEESVATHHYFDREFDIAAVKLLPNEYYVTPEDMVLSTVLGSCVSACVRDSTAGIGGMNHFMLPDDGSCANSGSNIAASMRYGAYAMEMLLNELLKAGARRERLEAKVFGGGAVLANMTMLNIGDRNADFVLRYLQMEQVRVAAQDLRGNLPRRISYFPKSGKVMVRKLHRINDAEQIQRDEQQLVQTLAQQPVRSKVELFDTTIRTANRAATRKKIVLQGGSSA
ncbi:CheD, stimulates methylation of MCP proteins [Collimonas sp. OK242]|jgi:chemotaxis protein CheD|uniref:chemoreceptor glutamine deamidase CheD n=1 Tax=Collimonas sp. OK242 TaxID=1798195 RepID=UPI000895B256|nr:chemoreceptor glutamine deamidase CheD [Collimonas sp. OK242]SDX47842.1 CheD, stimulates methylation of MCP proteins [Collimonas sp. OK242]